MDRIILVLIGAAILLLGVRWVIARWPGSRQMTCEEMVAGLDAMITLVSEMDSTTPTRGAWGDHNACTWRIIEPGPEDVIVELWTPVYFGSLVQSVKSRSINGRTPTLYATGRGFYFLHIPRAAAKQ